MIRVKVKVIKDKSRSKTYQQALNEAGFDYTRAIGNQMKHILIRRGNVFRGENGGLLGSIQARRLSNSSFGVYMKQSGIYLDRMKPHYVWLKKGRLIHKWALAKGNMGVKSLAVRQKGIFVRPSPFVVDSIREARALLPSIIRNRLRTAGIQVSGFETFRNAV